MTTRTQARLETCAMCQKFKAREKTRVEPKNGLLFSLDKKSVTVASQSHRLDFNRSLGNV